MSLTLFILFHSIILHTTLLCYPLLFPLHLMSLSLSSPDARSPPDSCYSYNTAGQCYGKCGIQQPCTTSCTTIPCTPEYVWYYCALEGVQYNTSHVCSGRSLCSVGTSCDNVVTELTCSLCSIHSTVHFFTQY